MSEERVEIISENERLFELEKDVEYYLTVAPPPRKVSTQKHTRLVLEHFNDSADQLSWELEEIRKCKEGADGMSPKMYFYYNYCWILNIEEGKIPPEFRVADDEWFDFVQEQQASKKWGIVCVKRRRVGASWKEASDVLHDALFYPFYKVGMNSKSEADSVELFKKVKFLYSNLAAFVRVKATAANTKMHMDFAYYVKDTDGSRVKRGNQSEITVVAPVPTAFEGWMLNKWVCDEAGKQKDLPQMWTYTEPCLRQETRRTGIPIIFGTSGEVGKEGAGLREMWKNSDAYNLKRFFFSGFHGLMIDEFGNDMREHSIRWIVYERYRKRNLDPKQYNDFVQQYPLTTSEAFSIANTGGIGNIVKINEQLANLRESPVEETRGSFMIESTGDINWKPSVHGKIIMYENRVKEASYNAGCDPADHDDAYDEASDLSLIIMRRQHNYLPPQIVLDYTDRPDKLTDFYRQALYAILYYNKTRILIERNRYRMIADLVDWGHRGLISTTPQGVTKLVGGRQNTLGIHMNDATKEYMEGLIDDYIEEFHLSIPSEKMLDECIKYGSVNTDGVMAWGICLMQMKEESMQRRKSDVTNEGLGMPKYIKGRGGIIQRA